MYEKNADIMSSLAGAKDTVSKGALSLLAKLKGSSQNDIDNSVRSQLPPDMAAGIDSVRDKVQAQLPSNVNEIVNDVRSQPMGELADKATKALSDLKIPSKSDTSPSALSYIPGIGGYLSGLAKPTPGRGRFVSSVGEGVSGNIGGAAGGAAGVLGGATLGGVGALLAALLSKGKIKPGAPSIVGGGIAGGLTGNSLGTHAGAGLFRDIAAKPEKSAELTGNQEEIDVNDNGKIEATDLANLRKGKKLSKDKTKFAEWTPAPSFSANMAMPNKTNPFLQGKKPSAKADASGAKDALRKLGSQDNCSPSRSAAGDSKGVKYKQQTEDHATGTAAFDSLDKYLRMSKKAGLNDFQSTFFSRLIGEGRNEQDLYTAVKHAGDQFGYEVGKELKKGLEKLAILGVLSGLGRAAMAGGRAIGGGVGGAYSGAKAGIAASGAGKAMGQAGTALGEAGQAARLAGSNASSAIGSGYQSAKGAIGTGLSNAGTSIGTGYQAAKGAIGTGLSNAGTSIGQNYQAAKGAIGGALPGMQQNLGNAATATGNFLGNNAKTIGAIGAGGGIAYGASQIPGAVEKGVNTAVNQGIDRGMDRFSSHMQQMPGQIGGMANQAMQNLPGQLSGMANQAMQKLPQMGGQTTGGFAGPYKQSSEKQAIAALVAGAKAALPAIGKYMGIAGGMPGAAAKGLYTAAKGVPGATTGDAIKAVLNNPAMKAQAITGASTGVMNPFTGLLATGDQDESWGSYLGRSALSGVAGAGAGMAGGAGTQNLMRRMGAGSQIGATGDLVGSIAGYNTGGMGAKGGFIGGGLMPAAVPKFLGNKLNTLAGGSPEVLTRMGQTILPRTPGSTAQLLEKLDPLSYLGSAAGSLIGKGYSAVKGNAPGALNAAKGWAVNNPIAASIAGVGGAGLAGGAYLGNRAVNAMEGARGDVNKQMNMFRAQTNNQMNGLREQIGGGMGGIGQFFNENKHWLMPALLAGGGALAGNALGGGTGAALGGLSLPALYMMSQNGMFGGGGAANPLLASAKPRADYAQQNQQYERENVDKQVAARNQDPRLASPTKPKTAGDRAVRLMRHFAKN